MKLAQVYKRVVGEGYKLKMDASRKILSEIIKKYPSMPFCLRSLEAKNARLGLVECLHHDLLQPYPVLHEKSSALVAQFKATVLLMPNGSDRITSAPAQEFKSEKQVRIDATSPAVLSAAVIITAAAVPWSNIPRKIRNLEARL